jgi:hypothetical protein
MDECWKEVGDVKVEKDGLLKCIGEVETLVDEFNGIVGSMKDEDDEIMCLINENMNLIRIIESELGFFERV